MFRWVFVLGCVLRVFAQPQPGNGPNLMREAPGLTPETAAQLEQALVTEPENTDTRMRLVRYYFLQAMARQRAEHIFWMIAQRPESALHGPVYMTMRPRTDAINTPAQYEQGRVLWTKAVEREPENGPILLNAARYFYFGDPFEADKVLLRARRIPAAQEEATNILVSHYSHATFAELSAGVASVYDPGAPGNEYRTHVRGPLATPNEAVFPGRVGLRLARPRSFPPDHRPPPELVDLYKRTNGHGLELLRRAQALEPANGEWRADPASPPARPTGAAAAGENLPVVASTVAPIYPALAAQARIQGVVRMRGVVGPGGELTNLVLVSGHPLFVQAAQDAARQSRHPDRAGQTVIIEVPFRLP